MIDWLSTRPSRHRLSIMFWAINALVVLGLLTFALR